MACAIVSNLILAEGMACKPPSPLEQYPTARNSLPIGKHSYSASPPVPMGEKQKTRDIKQDLHAFPCGAWDPQMTGKLFIEMCVQVSWETGTLFPFGQYDQHPWLKLFWFAQLSEFAIQARLA